LWPHRQPDIDQPGLVHVTPTDSLVSLLGQTRAAVAEHLRAQGTATTGELAATLAMSDVAVRKHLSVLGDDDLVVGTKIADGPGRPATHWALTPRGRRLWPDRAGDVADELLEFLEEEHGRTGLQRYLRWRLERQAAALAGVVDSSDAEERVQQLAAALDAAGFQATVAPAGDRFELTQQACALGDLPSQHPELCAYEAAAFSRVLGREVQVSRQSTIASGASACICCVSIKEPADAGARRQLPLALTGVPAQDFPASREE
jgi:predicted ArsR family transcriptional regulator